VAVAGICFAALVKTEPEIPHADRVAMMIAATLSTSGTIQRVVEAGVTDKWRFLSSGIQTTPNL
jgi:hypothetical protein